MLRKTKLVSGLVGLAFLCGFLCADQSRYIPWLNLYSQQASEPQYFWYLAARQGDPQAQEELLQFAVNQQSEYWLSELWSMGSTEAVFQLALQSEDQTTQKQLFTTAAHADHAPSQYELSLISDSSSAKLLWLQKAASSGHLLAQIALYQWYLLHDQIGEALPWLELSAQNDAQSALLYAKYLWKDKQFDQATNSFRLAAQLGDENGERYLHHIKNYWAKLPSGSTVSVMEGQEQSCAMRLQLVANNLESIIQASTFIKQFKQDQRLSSLPVCVNPPLWIENLNCSDNWLGQHRLGCDIGPLIPVAEERELTHIVVLAEQGKANVNNGIMYLDLADTYSVFVHELAHFAGFVDEYPLSTPMAMVHCFATKAPNILVMEEGEFPAYENMQQWYSDQHAIAPSKARTCNNHKSQAYKPTSELTFMEYHDQGTIPPLYLALWEKQLQNPANLTPVYVNFAQYLQAKGEEQNAQSWWQAFIHFRQSNSI